MQNEMIYWHHDRARPIAEVISIEDTPDGLTITAKLLDGVAMFRGFNKETGEAVYADSRTKTLAKILEETRLKTLCRAMSYLEIAELLSTWEITVTLTTKESRNVSSPFIR